MALNGNKTGQKITELIRTVKVNSPDDVAVLWQRIANAIYEDVKADIEVLIPKEAVVVDVKYGSEMVSGTNQPVLIVTKNDGTIKNEVL